MDIRNNNFMKAVFAMLCILLAAALFTGCLNQRRTVRERPGRGRISRKRDMHLKFTSKFPVDKANLADTGSNPFFILSPGYSYTVAGLEDKEQASETTEVTDKTKVVDGVKTRVVIETHKVKGEVDEISFNYFAIDKTTDSVYYFGEKTDIYENGKVTGHEGSWQSGEKGAIFGLIMPGTPLIGGRYMQEEAPSVALDRAEILSVTTTVGTTAGRFDDCLITRESSGLEKGVEFKAYAPGIGKIQDEQLLLTTYGFSAK